jgi:hypothetical protein
MPLDSQFLDRGSAERYFLDLQSRAYKAQQKVRQAQPKARDWGWKFSGRPRAFMREIIGPEWDTYDWQAWRAFISTVFCEPLETIGEWRTFRECTRLEEPPTERPPSVWMPVGRRGGKSRCLAAIAVYLACCYDWSPYLDPGELGILPVLAQDRRSSRTIMSYVKAFLDHPRLQDRVTAEQAESVTIDGTLQIEVVTASFRAVRNRTVIAALCDEIAFWRSDEGSANLDREVITALEPAMATIPNALLLGASSPYAQRGVLWDNFEKWFGKPGGPLIWKAATRVMNPTVPQEFIDEQYEQDPLAAEAEYGAQFRSDVDAFVTRDVLDMAVTEGVHEIPFEKDVRYFGFVDPSGGSSDSMTLAIGHVDRATRRGVLDVLRERRPPFSPENVVTEFAQVLHEYRVFRVKGDHYAGEWPADRFKRSGVGYEIAKKIKSDIYLEFLPLLNAQRCALLDNRTMYNQLLGLERRTARSGKETIDHVQGAHDDLANVAAGVMVELLGKRNPTAIDPSVLQRSAQIVRAPFPLLGSMTGPRWS